MGLWARKFTCACCGKTPIYDANNGLIMCDCGVFPAHHMTTKEMLDSFTPFHPMTVGESRKYLKEKQK